MQVPLHKVEEERCHFLNRIYGLSVRHKLDSKYITPEVDSSAAMCLLQRYVPKSTLLGSPAAGHTHISIALRHQIGTRALA